MGLNVGLDVSISSELWSPESVSSTEAETEEMWGLHSSSFSAGTGRRDTRTQREIC